MKKLMLSVLVLVAVAVVVILSYGMGYRAGGNYGVKAMGEEMRSQKTKDAVMLVFYRGMESGADMSQALGPEQTERYIAAKRKEVK